MKVNFQSSALGLATQIPTKSSWKSEGLKWRWSQISQQRTYLSHDLVNHIDALFEPHPRWHRFPLDLLQFKFQGCQHLAHLIVQLASNPPPLLLLRLQELTSERVLTFDQRLLSTLLFGKVSQRPNVSGKNTIFVV